MPKLSEVRAAAAQAAFWAHYQIKNPLWKSSVPASGVMLQGKRRTAEEIASERLTNADLESDLTDLIADVLILAKARNCDTLGILSAALSHVPDLGDAYYAVGRVCVARAEAVEAS